MANMIQIVDGVPVHVRFVGVDGRYIPAAELTAPEQVARNQFQRESRKERKAFLKAHPEWRKDEKQ